MIQCVTAGCSSDCQCVCLVRSVYPWIPGGPCCAYAYPPVLASLGCAQVAPQNAAAGDVIVWPAYYFGTNDGAGHIAVVMGNNGQGLMVLQANYYGNAAITTMAVPMSRAVPATVWRPPASRNGAAVVCQAAAGVASINALGMAPFAVCAQAGAPVVLATVAELEAWYLEYLGRPADAQGLAYWSQQPAATAQAAIASSAEAIAHRAATSSASTTPTTTAGLGLAAAVVAVSAVGLVGYRRVPAVRTAVLRTQAPLRPVLLRG